MRTPRTIVHFNKVENPSKKPLRLYIREGVVMNPKVEEAVKASADEFHIVGLRRAGEGFRSLVWEGEKP
jgi:hypothetical protein